MNQLKTVKGESIGMGMREKREDNKRDLDLITRNPVVEKKRW